METHKCSGHPTVRCECGGQLMIDGKGFVRLLQGFGFPSEGRDAGRFVVDLVEYEAYKGQCLKCRKQGMFVRMDRPPKPIRKQERNKLCQ